MAVVDAGHAKVNLYQFFSVSLQQNTPNVNSMHGFFKKKKEKTNPYSRFVCMEAVKHPFILFQAMVRVLRLSWLLV